MRSGTGQIGGKSAFSRPLFEVHTGRFPFSAVRFGKLCGEKFFAFSQTENDSLVIDLHICGFLCENRRNMRINMQKVFPTASGNHFFHPFFAKKG